MENKQTLKPSQSLVIVAFAAIYLIWGSTYSAIILALRTIPPFILAGIRFTGAGLMLLCWCMARKERIPSLSSLAKNALAGILMLGCGTTSLIWAEQYLPSGLSAIIVAVIPLWFVVLDKRHWKENLSNRFTVLGLLLGFAGILMLSGGNGPVNLRENRMQLISFIVLVSSGVVWVIGSLFSKYNNSSGSTPMKVSIQMFAAGLAGFLAAAIAGEYGHFSIHQMDASSLYAELYLMIMGSLAGYIAYIWLLSVRPPALVGTYAYVNPAIALVLGGIILGEKITLVQVGALIVILGGVMMVNLSKYISRSRLKIG